MLIFNSIFLFHNTVSKKMPNYMRSLKADLYEKGRLQHSILKNNYKVISEYFIVIKLSSASNFLTVSHMESPSYMCYSQAGLEF